MSVLKEPGAWLKAGETLVCLGDSLTAATNGYVSVLQKRLEPRGIKVVNAGVGGDKTIQGLMRLEKDVMALEPDAVSIFFGNNDCIIGRGKWRDEPVVSPVTFGENLQWMIHMMRLKTSIRKFSINTLTSRMEGAQYDEFGDVRREYIQAARRAADLANARLVPLDVFFDRLYRLNAGRLSEDDMLYTRDGLHMTEEGYRLIAEAMLKEWEMDD